MGWAAFSGRRMRAHPEQSGMNFLPTQLDKRAVTRHSFVWDGGGADARPCGFSRVYGQPPREFAKNRVTGRWKVLPNWRGSVSWLSSATEGLVKSVTK